MILSYCDSSLTSTETCTSLLGRSVSVKLFYQTGFQNPLFITLLSFFGQGLSLILYFASRRETSQKVAKGYTSVEVDGNKCSDIGNEEDAGQYFPDDPVISTSKNSSIVAQASSIEMINKFESGQDNGDALSSGDKDLSSDNEVDSSPILYSNDDTAECINQELQELTDMLEAAPPKGEDDISFILTTRQNARPARRGSKTGLTRESQEAAAWVHCIPWYLKPAIPGLLSLCNSAMRWGSLLYVAASIGEMLISGLELILSTVAARWIRKREISGMRWSGVIIVATGLIVVRFADILNDNKTEEGGKSGQDYRNQLIGDTLIIGQSILSVLQDMAEELFMQESEFPSMLLLGMEGAFGLLFGIPLFFFLAPIFGESFSETWSALKSSSSRIEYFIGLILVFAMTGVFNILATDVTSSMTRNVWKNFRTIFVWVLVLLIYYSSGNEDLGEEWIVPDSFFVLAGFVIMMLGTFVYYLNVDFQSQATVFLQAFRSNQWLPHRS